MVVKGADLRNADGGSDAQFSGRPQQNLADLMESQQHAKVRPDGVQETLHAGRCPASAVQDPTCSAGLSTLPERSDMPEITSQPQLAPAAAGGRLPGVQDSGATGPAPQPFALTLGPPAGDVGAAGSPVAASQAWESASAPRKRRCIEHQPPPQAMPLPQHGDRMQTADRVQLAAGAGEAGLRLPPADVPLAEAPRPGASPPLLLCTGTSAPAAMVPRWQQQQESGLEPGHTLNPSSCLAHLFEHATPLGMVRQQVRGVPREHLGASFTVLQVAQLSDPPSNLSAAFSFYELNYMIPRLQAGKTIYSAARLPCMPGEVGGARRKEALQPPPSDCNANPGGAHDASRAGSSAKSTVCAASGPQRCATGGAPLQRVSFHQLQTTYRSPFASKLSPEDGQPAPTLPSKVSGMEAAVSRRPFL